MIKPNPAADIQRVHSVIDHETTAIAHGDSKAYSAVLTDDAVFMPPNIPAKTGPALRQWLDDFLRSVSVRWLNFVHGETAAVGDLAFHAFTCSWRVTPKTGGEAKVLHFKGLHVLRRGADGVWRIHREIWNTNPEPMDGS